MEGDAYRLQEILDFYERCLGQVINKSKSVLLFSKNTKPKKRRGVCEKIQVTKETMNEKYLGLPVHVGNSKSEAFGYHKDIICARIQGWKEKFLS